MCIMSQFLIQNSTVDQDAESSGESAEFNDIEIIDSDVEVTEEMTYFIEGNVDVWESNGGKFDIAPSKEEENRESNPPKQPEKKVNTAFNFL